MVPPQRRVENELCPVAVVAVEVWNPLTHLKKVEVSSVFGSEFTTIVTNIGEATPNERIASYDTADPVSSDHVRRLVVAAAARGADAINLDLGQT